MRDRHKKNESVALQAAPKRVRIFQRDNPTAEGPEKSVSLPRIDRLFSFAASQDALQHRPDSSAPPNDHRCERIAGAAVRPGGFQNVLTALQLHHVPLRLQPRQIPGMQSSLQHGRLPNHVFGQHMHSELPWLPNGVH